MFWGRSPANLEGNSCSRFAALPKRALIAPEGSEPAPPFR